MDVLMKELAKRPSEALFGEGYSRLYQKDREIMHETMEMMKAMMGMDEGDGPGAGNEREDRQAEGLWQPAFVNECMCTPSRLFPCQNPLLVFEGYGSIIVVRVDRKPEPNKS